MSQIKEGDIVVHRMSKVQQFRFNLKNEYNSNPGVVIETRPSKSLILWDSYTEWVSHAYLLIVSKAE